jgi:hypothetical protein
VHGYNYEARLRGFGSSSFQGPARLSKAGQGEIHVNSLRRQAQVTVCCGNCNRYIKSMVPMWSQSPLRRLIHASFDMWTLHGSRNIDWLRCGRPKGRSSSPGRGKNFLFSSSSRPVLGPTQPTIQWILGALSPGVKRPGREADHSPPSPEVKNTCIYTSTPPYAFTA